MEILLWQARTNKGWVLEQLEKKSGVSKATLNRIENGQTSPTMDVMEKVAKALNIRISDLQKSGHTAAHPVTRRKTRWKHSGWRMR